MKLSLGTNFDPQLLEGLAGSAVRTVYGKMPIDRFGGGRPSLSLPPVSREQVEAHVQLAHSLGIEFNYLMNAVCMDAAEFTPAAKRDLFDTIDWLRSLGVEMVTVSTPVMVELVRRRAPDLRISLSTFAYVDSLQKALAFERMGVHEITLPEGLNRNFRMLELLKRNLRCELQVIATNVCMAACPHRIAHANFQSHASQETHVGSMLPIDFSMLSCTAATLADPVEVLKMPWIRPEDVHHYEAIGIDKVKLTERMKTTAALLRIARAYSERRYDGNLDELLNFRVRSEYLPPNRSLIASKAPSPLVQRSRELLFARAITIRNRPLDGFLEFFVKSDQDCRNVSCGETCRHCHAYAGKALVYDEGKEAALLADIERFTDDLCRAETGASASEMREEVAR